MTSSQNDQPAKVSIPVSRRGFLGSSAAALAMQSSLAKGADRQSPLLWAYTDQLSYQAGETLRLYVSTSAKTCDVSVVRVGKQRERVWSRTDIPVKEYPIPEDASSHGCRWPVALELKIPSDWTTGYYEIETRPEPGEGNSPYFVIRPTHPGRDAKILLQLSTNTDNAYNNWGGYSIYAYNGRDGVQGRRVSFQRPMPGTTVQKWETPFIRWAESNGYKIDYAVNNDLEFHPEILKNYRLVLSVGHDEYWSAPMRDHLENFIADGGNVAFFSGNVACWQIRNEDAGQALVCYKQYFKEDPRYRPDGPNPLLTTLWSHHLIGRPENQMTGVGVLSGGFHLSHGQYMDGSGAFTIHRPDHWVFAGTKLAKGDPFGGEHTIAGYECDGCEFELQEGVPVATGRDGTPENFQILATAPAKWGTEETLIWYQRWPENQQGAACLGLYTKSGGGTVFTAGTTDWSHGLGEKPGEKPDPLVDRITRNVLNRLG